MKLKVENIKKANAYKINREENKSYILYCAALSFNKSLVGISELKALETCSKSIAAGGLRMSRALSSYYSVYHLFVLNVKKTNYLNNRYHI
jgi:hypothetical protein